jgi:hypothetical protein
MILLSIELQTECGATSVDLSRMIAEDLGLIEELVVKYLLATGWRLDSEDPELFWAPRWLRHERTEQDYQLAESWVLATSMAGTQKNTGSPLGDQQQLATPSAEGCC